MKKTDLVIYEMPSVSEFISWPWFQEIIARYTAYKVNRKWKRYTNRLQKFNL